MRVMDEIRDPWAAAIALAAGAVALGVSVPPPLAIGVALAVLLVRLGAGLWIPVVPRILAVDAGHGPGGALTHREAEIAAMVSEGLTNRQIADKLVISERTVDNHVQSTRR